MNNIVSRLSVGTAMCVAILLVNISATAATPATQEVELSVEAAIAAAASNSSTPQGKAFEESVGGAFGAQQAKMLRACFRKLGIPATDSLKLVIRLDVKGKVDRSLTGTNVPAANCIALGLQGWQALAPPRAGYWVAIDVRLRRG